MRAVNGCTRTRCARHRKTTSFPCTTGGLVDVEQMAPSSAWVPVGPAPTPTPAPPAPARKRSRRGLGRKHPPNHSRFPPGFGAPLSAGQQKRANLAVLKSFPPRGHPMAGHGVPNSKNVLNDLPTQWLLTLFSCMQPTRRARPALPPRPSLRPRPATTAKCSSSRLRTTMTCSSY